MSHVINSRALTGEKQSINKAIHALLLHGYATFNMTVPGPQICYRYEMCTARPLNEHSPWKLRSRDIGGKATQNSRPRFSTPSSGPGECYCNAWKAMFDPYIDVTAAGVKCRVGVVKRIPVLHHSAVFILFFLATWAHSIFWKVEFRLRRSLTGRM